MSDLDVQGGAAPVSDDEFDQFVSQNQETADSNKNANARQFTDILYTSIPQPTSNDPDAMKLVRFRGGPPDSNRTPYTARKCISSLVRDDNDKLFKLKLPVADRKHLYWRIINTVLETEGTGNQKTYVHKDRMPDAFNRIRYGSAKPTANQFKFDKGWKGREWLVANVIDREQMDVHRKEKHTMILCKDARPSKNNPDIVFYDEGVPAYGFIQPLVQNLFKPYKNWENYDVGIFRTGQKTMPYRLINASRYTPEVPDHMKDLVYEEGPLTDEELSWDLYDLEKLCSITPYTKFLDRQGQLIIEIDNYLGTHFFEELQDLAEQEKKERGDQSQEEDTPTSVTSDGEVSEEEEEEEVEQEKVPTREEEPAPVRTRAKKREPVEAEDDELSKLKDKLRAEGFSEEELDLITSYDPSKPAHERFTYSVPTGQLLRCPECGVPSPQTFHKCPNPDCLYEFE